VQTVALRLIVEREREIRAFQKREYWSIDVHLAAKKPPVLNTQFVKRNDESLEIADETTAANIVTQLDGAEYVVASVATKEKRRNAVAPFITSTVQQEAARKLRFSVKRTMMLAQKLYEGVELGKEGAVGLITYMRTDSTRVSDDALAEVRQLIGERFGSQYMPAQPNVYKSKKDIQDAHEAIRPTSALRTPETLESFLAEDELKLYRLIWMRFIASQMSPAVFDQTTIEVTAKGKDNADYRFRATGSVPRFDGFLAVYEEGKDVKDSEDEELKHRLPAVAQGEVLKFRAIEPEQHFTEPPPRFNEATLVKELEANGVGRPSTYAAILSTIQEREYVKKEGGRFTPTELGMVVADLLVENFDHIFDIKYTARMEEELDEIEDGKLDWRVAMSEFYGQLKEDLEHAEQHMTDIKRMEKPTDLICDKCGKPMVIKWGQHGSFLACTGYPDFSPRSAEADLESLEKEAAKRQNAVRTDIATRLGKIQARYSEFEIAWGEHARFIRSGRDFPKGMKAALEKHEKAIAERLKKDRDLMERRLATIQARYPRMNESYDLALQDTAEGVNFIWRRNENFCTNTRELTVDLPDVDKADLSGEMDSEEYCENCGRPMVLKKGRFGQFYACSGYPDCKTTKQIGGTQKKSDVPLEEKCPNCGNHLVMKHGRFGEFTACSNYPTCKFVKQKTIGVKCPNCNEGEVVERRSKRGKTFYGCNRYPDCDFVAWGKPIPEQCPNCSNPYLIEKWLKAGPVAQCPNPECKYKKDLPQPVEALATP
jgi:DNA topoisomerase-1